MAGQLEGNTNNMQFIDAQILQQDNMQHYRNANAIPGDSTILYVMYASQVALQ